jgi:hypothetical protein
MGDGLSTINGVLQSVASSGPLFCVRFLNSFFSMAWKRVSFNKSAFLIYICDKPLPGLMVGRVLLLLVGSSPCRNPKCATRKNVPAIYMTCGSTHTTVFLPIICCWQTLFGKIWVMDQRRHGRVFKGRLKKFGWMALWEILQAASKWVKHDVCLVVDQTLERNFFTGRQSEKTSFLTF